LKIARTFNNKPKLQSIKHLHKKIDLKTNNNKYLKTSKMTSENKFISIGNISDKGKSTREGNKGEKDEIKYKKELFEKRMDIEYCTSLFGNDACEGIEIINPTTKLPYASIEQIKKAPSGSKADVIILLKHTNVMRYSSMKSLRGAKPSILNHTPRSANIFQTTLQPCICELDSLAKEYINNRKNKIINERRKVVFGEDIEFRDMKSFHDEKIKTSFMKMLSYFIFKGTGKKLSPIECDSILVINKDGSLTFTDCGSEEKKMNYVETIIEQCRISFRPKGMPKKIVDNCLPWIYTDEVNGKQCGSIHVRL